MTTTTTKRDRTARSKYDARSRRGGGYDDDDHDDDQHDMNDRTGGGMPPSRTGGQKRENKYANMGRGGRGVDRKYNPPAMVNNHETHGQRHLNAVATAVGVPSSQQPYQTGPNQPTTTTTTTVPSAPRGGYTNVGADGGVLGRAIASPRSDCNVDKLSPQGERPPARVFFPARKGDRGPTLRLDDSVTIDSEIIDDPSIQQMGSPGSPAVYHLARDDGLRTPSPRHRAKLEAWYRKNGARGARDPRNNDGGGRAGLASSISRDEDRDYHADMSRSISTDDGTNYTGFSHGVSTVGTNDYPESLLSKDVMSEDEDFLHTKQDIALLSITLTSVQLLTICLQFAMCGIAPFEVNPFIGPYPDAFSEWGGKNAYLMLTNREYWRIVSPSALSVGVLHLLANAFCQLEPIAIFEREWGSFRWLLIYLLSAVGCNTLSVYMDPDSIAVGSSGSLMGLFSAKLAQVLIHTLFDVNKRSRDEFIRLDQLGSVVFGLIIVSLFSFFTYIDWSGHLGGLLTGFFAGMVLFSNPIRSCCVRFLWTFLGLTGLTVTLTGCVFLALTETDPSAELADTCYYFRDLYPEDHECGCFA